MGSTTYIEWCHHTFNPWIGCAKVSPGCKHCYAEVDTFARVQRGKGNELWGPNASRHVTSDNNWKQPLKWNQEAKAAGERRRVFCASLCDWLEDRTDLYLPRLWLLDTIDRTPHLDWLMLTKRIDVFGAVLHRTMAMGPEAKFEHADGSFLASDWLCGNPPANVWLGTSVEDQQRANERVPLLAEIPAVVRFLSVEPLLGLIDPIPCLDRIDWVIVGGESGGHARPCDLEWFRSIVRQCADAGVACFVKQLGANHWAESPECGHARVPLEHPKGGDPREWPIDLRVRQFSIPREATP